LGIGFFFGFFFSSELPELLLEEPEPPFSSLVFFFLPSFLVIVSLILSFFCFYSFYLWLFEPFEVLLLPLSSETPAPLPDFLTDFLELPLDELLLELLLLFLDLASPPPTEMSLTESDNLFKGLSELSLLLFERRGINSVQYKKLLNV
jgi:hypothetical protein